MENRQQKAQGGQQKTDDWVAALEPVPGIDPGPKAKGMAEHRGSRQVHDGIGTRGVSLHSACEDCKFSTPAVGTGEMVLTCDHSKPANRLIVKADNWCDKFVRSRELLDPCLAAVLAEGAKLIPLSQGKFAIVDPEDFDELSQYKWTAAKSPNTFYAVRSDHGRQIRMHRLITNAPKGLVVDHINHNGLDNRKSNLRLCTRSENARNQRPQTNRSSKYKGVCWHKNQKKWLARVYSNGVTYHLGSFKSQIAAAKAYDKKAKQLFGKFACLNFPPSLRASRSDARQS